MGLRGRGPPSARGRHRRAPLGGGAGLVVAPAAETGAGHAVPRRPRPVAAPRHGGGSRGLPPRERARDRLVGAAPYALAPPCERGARPRRLRGRPRTPRPARADASPGRRGPHRHPDGRDPGPSGRGLARRRPGHAGGAGGRGAAQAGTGGAHPPPSTESGVSRSTPVPAKARPPRGNAGAGPPYSRTPSADSGLPYGRVPALNPRRGRVQAPHFRTGQASAPLFRTAGCQP